MVNQCTKHMALWLACNLSCQFSNGSSGCACKEHARGWEGDRTLDGLMGSDGIGWFIGLQTLQLKLDTALCGRRGFGAKGLDFICNARPTPLGYIARSEESVEHLSKVSSDRIFAVCYTG